MLEVGKVYRVWYEDGCMIETPFTETQKSDRVYVRYNEIFTVLDLKRSTKYEFEIKVLYNGKIMTWYRTKELFFKFKELC